MTSQILQFIFNKKQANFGNSKYIKILKYSHAMQHKKDLTLA